MLLLDSLASICSLCHDIISWLCQFIECQLDTVYLGWLVALLLPTLITVFVLPLAILLLLYVSALVLYIYTLRWRRLQEVLNESLADFRLGARYLISLIWDITGYIWHGYEVVGLGSLPANGLIVYYHGAIPVDAYYLVARAIIREGRHIHCVGDRFLQRIPGWQSILDVFQVSPSSVEQCVKTVQAGNLVAISPGGVREAQFSDHSYPLMWGNRAGFAKVALRAKCPVVPMYTRNVREAFRVMSFPAWLWAALYQRFRLPFAPIYGGFPVKLVTYLGPAIHPEEGESPEALAARVRAGVEALIARHQRLPGNILAALCDRVLWRC